MKSPTSRYGCGDESCEACYGDAEYQRFHRAEDLRGLVAIGNISHEEAEELLELEETFGI